MFGQGLSVALIERPENYVTLIDLGSSTGFTPLKHLTFKYNLRPDVLYITHPHADHITDVETAIDPQFRPLGIHYQTYAGPT
jgi:glyoxylase-like metal-dependent hydrolase (beta-lactamase superfamily II)